MAAGQGGDFFKKADPPVAGCLPFDGELQRRFGLGAAEDGRAGEQPSAQCHQLALAERAEPAL